VKKILAFLIWIAALSYLIYYLVSNANELKDHLHISAFDIVALALLFLCLQSLNCARTMLLIKKVGLQLTIPECFSLTNINTMVNYLPFKGGLLAMAIYFKNRYKLSYTTYANLVIASYLIQLMTVSIASVVFILVHFAITKVFLAKLFWIFSLIFVAVLISVVLLVRVHKNIASADSIWDKIKKAVTGLDIVLHDKQLLFKILCINLSIILTMGARFAICFKILSFNAPLILSLLTGQVKTIAALLSIVPSGLGIAEFFAGGISELMDSGLNIGVYAASIDRIVSVLVLLCIGSISFAYLWKKNMNVQKERQVTR